MNNNPPPMLTIVNHFYLSFAPKQIFYKNLADIKNLFIFVPNLYNVQNKPKKFIIVKKTFLLIAFIARLAMNGQVEVDTVFYNPIQTLEFVSDDGNGTYTIAAWDSTSTNGYLAVLRENTTPHLEMKYFPPDLNHGSVHDADAYISFTINDTTYATGRVANSIYYDWYVLRKYLPRDTNYVIEKKFRNCGFRIFNLQSDLYMFFHADFNQGYSDLMNSGWNITNTGEYLIKLNKQDLSIDWIYQINNVEFFGDYNQVWSPVLLNNFRLYRYPIQLLPNGNIAITVTKGLPSAPNEPANWLTQFWEINSQTGQFVRVIDDSYTDYDGDGVQEHEYRRHRWRIINGVLYHIFSENLYDSNDFYMAHWEKLEIPGWTLGGSTPWESSNLVITAVSDLGEIDTFHTTPMDDFYVDNGLIRFGGYRVSWEEYYLSENFALYKREVDHSGVLNGLDVNYLWGRPNGEVILMGYHLLSKLTSTERFSNHVEVVPGNNVIEARNGQVFHNGWQQRAGEATIVVNHSAMPQEGDMPDPSWLSIPNGFYFGGALPIKMETNPDDEDYGRLHFDFGTVDDTLSGTPSELLLRVWVLDANAVSVPETEISGLSLYPNPVESFLTVEADKDVDAVRVFNMSGIKVKEVRKCVHSVYVGDLPTGVYIVEVTAADKVSRRMVVKM